MNTLINRCIVFRLSVFETFAYILPFVAGCKLRYIVLYINHRDLDNSVFVSLSRELFCFDYVLYSLSYAWSRDLIY